MRTVVPGRTHPKSKSAKDGPPRNSFWRRETGDGFFFTRNISDERNATMEASKPNGKAEGSESFLVDTTGQ
jgi:hypothetical protein